MNPVFMICALKNPGIGALAKNGPFLTPAMQKEKANLTNYNTPFSFSFSISFCHRRWVRLSVFAGSLAISSMRLVARLEGILYGLDVPTLSLPEP